MSELSDLLSQRDADLRDMVRPQGWAFSDVPPDPVVVRPFGHHGHDHEWTDDDDLEGRATA